MLKVVLSLLLGSLLLSGCVSTSGASAIIAADDPGFANETGASPAAR